MKRAVAFLKAKRILLQPVSQTTVGLWIGHGPVVAIDETDVSKLGENVLKALAGSREGIPHPTSWKGSFDLVLKAAGVKSWTAFVKSAKRVEIKFSTNRVNFVPTENCGSRDGFQSLDELTLDCPPTENDLTTTLFAAFEACK